MKAIQKTTKTTKTTKKLKGLCAKKDLYKIQLQTAMLSLK